LISDFKGHPVSEIFRIIKKDFTQHTSIIIFQQSTHVTIMAKGIEGEIIFQLLAQLYAFCHC
jgi:hypothetical protein